MDVGWLTAAGVEWSRDPAREPDTTNHELQRGVKARFDPHGILNPGKAI